MTRYLLAVLSHGDPESPTVERAFTSFHEHVSPKPSITLIHHDGPGHGYRPATMALPEEFIPWAVSDGNPHLGFCGATRELWHRATAAAANNKCPYVFWLEHDFTFDRDIDLSQLAAVLDANPMLFQMSLMRDAANDVEREAGGLVASRPGEFTQREAYFDPDLPASPWLEHTSYMTTTPSLLLSVVMQANPWPSDGLPECEGRFGIELVERGYRFGVWGDGSPAVTHIGTRTGKGY